MTSGNYRAKGRPADAWGRLAFLATFILLVPTRTGVAGFVGTVSGVAGITYNVDVVSSAGAGPIYGTNNDLQNINGLAAGYGSIALGSNVSNFGSGIATPNMPLGSFGPSEGPTSTATGTFGGGTTSLFAATIRAG